jgi:DNA-binding MarR family transcriptional regulator
VTRDHLDMVLAQWAAETPELDATPMGVVGRLQRASRLLDKAIADRFADHGLQLWEFDLLATLLRSGAPYELTAGRLGELSMVTSGAITNRVDRLVQRGLVDRRTDPDNRRSVLISLTESGNEAVRGALVDHVDNEKQLLAVLGPRERTQLAGLLRTLLVGLGDVPQEE